MTDAAMSGQQRFCDLCGAENRAQAQFCKSCGGRLVADSEIGRPAPPHGETREPPKAAPGGSRSGRRNPTRRSLVGLGVLLSSVALFATYSELAASAYSAAGAAYDRFECQAAATRYREVAGRYRFAFRSHAGEARRRAEECAKVLRAQVLSRDGAHAGAAGLLSLVDRAEVAGSPLKLPVERLLAREVVSDGDQLASNAILSGGPALFLKALGRYDEVLLRFPRTQAARAARASVDNVLTRVLGGGACESADNLAALAGASVHAEPVVAVRIRARRAEPRALLACGKREFLAKHWGAAVSRFRAASRYKGTAAAAEAASLLIDAEVFQIRGRGTGRLPSPVASGTSGTSAVTLDVQNASPYPLDLLISGPHSAEFTVPACAGCTKYFQTGPASCPSQAPRSSFTVVPGKYDVVVRSARERDQVTPWSSAWNLDVGIRYVNCFYIVTHF
jgi:hypothetical protein